MATPTRVLAVALAPRRLSPGLLVGVQRDLTEPLAYALVVAGAYLFDYGGRRTLLWAGLTFGLAGLVRQTLVFPLCIVGAMLLVGSGTPLAQRLRSTSARPPASLRSRSCRSSPTSSFYFWLGSIAKGTRLEWVPFAGLAESRDWELKRQGVVIVTLVVPALMFA